MEQKSSYHYNTSWEKVRRLFPNGQELSILDVGCGDGRLVTHLIPDHDVYGIDSDHEAVKRAYTQGINAVKGNLADPLPFRDEMFDVVFALDVLEHIYDLSFALGEIKRVLKSDGYFIISLPNHFDLRTRFDIFFGKGIIKWSQREFENKSWEYSHIRFLTLTELRAMLFEQGWFIDCEQFNFMSGGLMPTRYLPEAMRSWLVSEWPGAWSGKFVVRCRRREAENKQTILINTTPENF